ncbi:MAG: OsmC family protein [Acidobacteriota bacterium]|nr:OsmC family protein [Acidobacteriota bacterium]MDE3190819.1 OsmC family protein [Acidobacteriota bacterium]
MDLREAQRPIKDRYRADPDAARITLTARGSETAGAAACSVDIGRAAYAAQAHAGVGGEGTAPCSGDLLLGALAACAQVTCQMVASASGIETTKIEVTASGELDLRGTLGIDREAPVGFDRITLRFDVEGAGERRDELIEKTLRYCVVLKTLEQPPRIEIT